MKYIRKIVASLLRKLKLLPPANRLRKDVERIYIQANLYFIVYWKLLDLGKGPTIVLEAFNEEILRFDCFGKEKGHYHIAPNFNLRIYFVEDSAEAQIDRTEKELLKNASKYLKNQRQQKIRNISIDHEKFHNALDLGLKRMRSFLSNIPELERI